MLIDLQEVKSEHLNDYDVCIVGSGPAGIVIASELNDFGCRVLLLESGLKKNDRHSEVLSDAIISDLCRHAPMNEATSRRLGGTSDNWGGRCLPLDPVDFEGRSSRGNSSWPLSFVELEKYYNKACTYCLCGENNFLSTSSLPSDPESIVPGLLDGDILSSTLERWSLPVDFWEEYGPKLIKSKNVTVIYNATCTNIEFAFIPDKVSAITIRTFEGRERHAAAKCYVLACGGLETTRLMLNSDRVHRGGIGNHSGKLGHYYMGHISGKIAQVKFSTPPEETIYGFERDHKGIYCRRRFTIAKEVQNKLKLLNFSAWLDNPPMYDASHGNGILSLAFIALSIPIFKNFLGPKAIVKKATGGESLSRQTIQHLKNVFFDMPDVISFVSSFVYKRYFVKRKIPGFFLPNRNNEYALHYHAEHAPDYESRVSLSDECNEMGVRKLLVDLEYNALTIKNIIQCHQILDNFLQRNSCGRLIYTTGDLESRIVSQASDGFHQLGTTRMSEKPVDGVVDANCCVHGIQNLFVCSSSVFPTSGQANPTLTIVALSIRLAEFLDSFKKGSRP